MGDAIPSRPIKWIDPRTPRIKCRDHKDVGRRRKLRLRNCCVSINALEDEKDYRSTIASVPVAGRGSPRARGDMASFQQVLVSGSPRTAQVHPPPGLPA